MADIFISYASADRDKARVIAETFGRLGFSVWWDRTIAPGEVFDEVLQRALDDAKCVVVLWSAKAVSSSWVKTEAAEASARNILVPALIEEARLPIEFKRIQSANLIGWNSDAAHPEFQSLLASVRRLMARPALAEAAASSGGNSAPVRPTPSAAPRALPRWTVVALALGAAAAALATAIVLMQSAAGDRPAKGPTPVAATPTNNAKTPSQPPAAAPEPRPQAKADAPAPEPKTPPTISAQAQPKAAQKPAEKSASTAPPSRTPATPVTSKRVNLLASENGGQLVMAGDPIWMKSITQYEDQQGWAAFGEAVYAFKDQRAAVFDTFSVLIVRTHEANLKEFMLLAGNDSPTGRFEPIGQFTVQNVRMIASPYQDFSFAPVKAKYLKVKLINTHGGRTGGAVLHKFKVMGSLE